MGLLCNWLHKGFMEYSWSSVIELLSRGRLEVGLYMILPLAHRPTDHQVAEETKDELLRPERGGLRREPGVCGGALRMCSGIASHSSQSRFTMARRSLSWQHTPSSHSSKQPGHAKAHESR